MSSEDLPRKKEGEERIRGIEANTPQKVSRRKFLTYLGIAGAGAAVGGAVYLNMGSSPQQVSQPPSRKPLTIAEPKNPQNYTPDEYYEFIKWLQSVSDKVAGNKIRVALEAEVGQGHCSGTR